MNQLYIGVDYHPYSQVIAFCDLSDGEIIYQMFDHCDKQKIREFYGSFSKGTVVGVEATGYQAGRCWVARVARIEALQFNAFSDG